MGARAETAPKSCSAGRLGECDLGFLPKNLTMQCQSLIANYHEVYGFACLPDVLWKSRLGPFIERHHELGQLLREASRTRSAKRSREGFVQIATTILSMEILASSFAGWSAICPEAAERARALLESNGGRLHTPLMEYYLYQPKYTSAATLATLAPPPDRGPWETAVQRT